jgi:hypothetical protein
MKAATVSRLNTAAFVAISIASYQGGMHGHSWIGIFVFAVLASLLLIATDEKKERLILTGITAIAGFVLDSVLIMASVYKPLINSGPAIPEYLCPLWILALWLSFGYMLHIYRQTLTRNIFIAPTTGPIYALMIYGGANHNKLIKLHDPAWQNLFVIALAWMILMPILLRVSNWIYKGKVIQNANQ